MSPDFQISQNAVSNVYHQQELAMETRSKISESITMGEVIWENKAKWSPILKYLLSGIKGTNLRL